MRASEIILHNNQTLEVFTQPHDDGFELWKISTIKGKRTVLDHYLTHDDLERRFAYVEPGDIVWRDANPNEIPGEKHASARETEKSIERGTFWDLQSIAGHVGAIDLVPLDRKAFSAATKAILGEWTDGAVTLTLEPESRLKFSCLLEARHPLNMGSQMHGQKPDWWGFAYWQLSLLNYEKRSGQRTGVLRVDNKELHIYSEQPDRLAHVLHRVST